MRLLVVIAVSLGLSAQDMQIRRKPIAVVANFAPTDLANLALWLKGDGSLDCSGACSNNSQISWWYDASGNANHASIAPNYNPPLFITSGLNSKPVVRFATVDSFSLTSAIPFGSGVTAFAVVKVSGSGYPVTILAGGSGSTDWRVESGKQNSLIRAGLSAIASGTAGPSTSWLQQNFSYDGTSYVFRVSKASDGSGTASASIDSGIDRVGTFANAEFFKGDMAELLIYSRVLTLSDKQKVEDYLAAKWGL